jgi:serine/threonine-protein kinase/endoribonuclease IRE1
LQGQLDLPTSTKLRTFSNVKIQDRDVAIKRMLPQYFGLAEQEVKLLQESDLHQNVIRYFDDEKDENFLYIAVELCQASLFDLYHDGRPSEDLTETQQRLVNEINADVPSALRQLAKGVNHLHGLRIIHRDIKPQNILIAYPQRNMKKGPRLVISDFGLCKTLPDNVSTLIGTTGNAGTTGWKAPELILQPKEIMNMNGSSTGHSRDSSSSTDPVSQGVKRAVDIFSLGCVFFYVLTNGSHPFDDDEGWMQIRELNIKKDKANFKQLTVGDDSVEPIHLISWMLSNRPEDRPTASQVINHPFFWTAEKRLNFLCDCSDHWEREPRDPPSQDLSVLESYSSDVLDKKRDFLAKLDRGFILSLGKQRKYTGDRMLDLLRALRNKKNHYEDMEESVKAKVGALPEGYLKYWTIKFPKLVMCCYEAVKQCGLQEEPRFKGYFQGEIVN